jgi:hypothetical protein
VGQPSDHGVTHDALAATATAPPVRLEDTAGQHGTIRFEALARHLEPKLVETAEGGQVSAREPSIRARRDGSVGHVEVFRMVSVRTSILGRPRRLSAHRRAGPVDADHTLNCEEPAILQVDRPRLDTGARALTGSKWSREVYARLLAVPPGSRGQESRAGPRC